MDRMVEVGQGDAHTRLCECEVGLEQLSYCNGKASGSVLLTDNEITPLVTPPAQLPVISAISRERETGNLLTFVPPPLSLFNSPYRFTHLMFITCGGIQ